MTVSTAQYLKGFYDQTRGMGAKVVNADFALEIENFESLWLLCKQAPWPEIAPAGEIEVATPLGSAMWQPQQIKTAQQGQIMLMETVAGTVDTLTKKIVSSQGGIFNAKIYEGTPQQYLRAKRLVDCFWQLDNPDRDWENRSQILTFSGTLFFHYFGDDIQGNSGTY